MDETDAEQEPRIKTIEEYHERAPRRWPLLLGYILVALAIAVVVVFGARGIYHHYHKPASKSVAATAKSTKSTQSSTSASQSGGSGSTTGTNSSSSTAGSQPASTNLPNSGPGQVSAIFLASSAAAAGTHYLIKLRRQKQF